MVDAAHEVGSRLVKSQISMLVSPNFRPATLVDLLQQRAADEAVQRLYTFLGDSEDEAEQMTYRELDRRARLIGAALQAVAPPGERVLLLYPPGLEYIAGFFGCLYAGMVAVPAYPPDPMRLERTLPRLRAIIQDAQATMVLTTSPILEMGDFIFEQAPDFKALRWMASDAPGFGDGSLWRRPELTGDTLAFLQYTSGSTGTPKGVMLTHDNLLHNLKLISHGFQVRPGGVGVIWLPPYHDMGLIGGILEPLFGGMDTVLMSPMTFLRRPFRWLEAVSRYKGTISGGPNFAFDLCARRITPEERQRLDLSSWEVAFSGAEPIRTETLDRFTEAFAPCGFRREAFYPCYGLAEGTLIVSGGDTAAQPVIHTLDAGELSRNRAVRVEPSAPGARSHVGCGRTLPDQDIAIVEPESLTPCAPGAVGEIWVSGPSVARGYWNKPEETERTFHARLPGDSRRYLRTGDLGLLMEDGELLVTGRLKDLIIIRGRNHYPQDIELTVDLSHPSLRPGCTATFSIDVNGEEQLAVVVEVAKNLAAAPDPEALEAVAGAIRQAVSSQHELQVHTVALIPPGAIFKTSSGKIQRRACRAALLSDTLELVWRSTLESQTAPLSGGPEAPASEPLPLAAAGSFEERRALIDRCVREEIAAVLGAGARPLDAGTPLARLGLDSLGAVELRDRLERRLQVNLSAVTLLEDQGLAALVETLAREPDPRQPVLPPLRPGPREARAPASFAQFRLWVIQELEPRSTAYHIPVAIALSGPLAVPALERSLGELLRRHEVLRTSFATVDGGLVQVIHPPAQLALDVVELPGLSAQAREAAVAEHAARDGESPFDISRGPLLRASLLRFAPDAHVLLLSVHHLVADGWSLGVFVRELAALYPAFLAGQPSPLPEPSLQYSDFSRWQHQAFTAEVLAPSLDYWRAALSQLPPPLALPTDRPRPPRLSFHGARRSRTIPAPLMARLRALGQQEGLTPFTLLLSALSLVLHRWSHQSDFIIGTAVSGRDTRGIGELVGDCTNFLPLRMRLSGADTARQFLARVKETTLGAMAHAHCPFEKIVAAVQPGEGPRELYNVAFVLDDFEIARDKPLTDALSASLLLLDNRTTEIDMTFEAAEGPEGLAIGCKYSSDLFDPATVDRLLGHLHVLIAGLVAEPDQRVGELPLLTEEERHLLLVAWNDTRVAYPREECLHGLIEAQVERTPDAVAVDFQGTQLTYRQLDERANQLAHHLRSLGVGPESRVALCVERSLEMVVGLVGILKAGGAYVPLDPTYPREQLTGMMEDIGAPVLLTQRHLLERLPRHEAQVVCLDSEEAGIGRWPVEAPPSVTTADNLAYIIFTSGSTGRPKGAMNAHRGICNRLRWMQEAYRLTGEDRVLQKTPFSFDVSVWEFFWPLMTGARIVLAIPGGHKDPAYLARLIAEQRITTLHFVPSMLQAFLAEPDLTGCASLRRVICSGEALPLELKERCLARLGAPLYNLYGPTEAAVDVTHWTCEPQDGRRSIPIGRPVSNTRIYVLDAGLRPTPIGIPGELHIGGVQVGRGYFGRPHLTAERFIPDPFSDEPGARLYKTGDLARFLSDGTVEFLGRLDNQVKVRGFRIELGEVESALSAEPAVREAVVLAREDVPGDKRLVAYVVLDDAALAAEAPPAVEQDRTSQWEAIYDETYAQGSEDATFDVSGWNDSYTGEPIPREQMREWVDTTVEQILALRPRRVLELGCGTGLLLYRIAPRCEAYWGMDLSQAALRRIQHHCEASGGALSSVKLLHRRADDLSGIEEGSFDTVVLNSVVQYFPGPDYLLRVLEGAVRLVRPGGHIFIGDVRNLRLLEAFWASVHFRRAASGLSSRQLLYRMQREVMAEKELVLDPSFFQALRQRLPAITRVEIRPKRGRYDNELSRFRYEAVLHVGGEPAAAVRPTWLDGRGLSLGALRTRLSEERPAVLGLRQVPNARVREEVRLVELLTGVDLPATVAGLREALRARATPEGLEPEDLYTLGAELGYTVQVSWAGAHRDGAFDVAFVRAGETGGDIAFPVEPVEEESSHRFANDSLRGTRSTRALTRIRQALAGKLPEHMVPSAFLVLPTFPLTSSGKVNRRALPAPEAELSRQDGEYVAPRTPMEAAVARLFGELLGHARVGALDDFFALGGHSLLATQVVSRLRAMFQVELPVRVMFEARTPAALAAHLEASHPEPRGAQTPALERVPRAEEAFPLSFAQQRLWFIEQLEPGQALYNIPIALRLHGALDVGLLGRAFAEVVRRHESLRTTFLAREGRPLQRIQPPPAEWPLPVTDLSALAPEERAGKLETLMTAEAIQPFELTTGPLLRTSLLRLGQEEHVLLLNMHHIISDGWSMGVLVREVAVAYEAAHEGRPSPLPELPVQYVDFARWHQRALTEEVLAPQLAYWKERLARAVPLELPADRRRPAVRSQRGGTIDFKLPRKLVAALEQVGQAQDATLFMTLLAAFKVLLSRYSGQGDICVGMPIANRTRAELEPLIGFFVNTLVLRTDLSDDPRFPALVGRVREAALGAYAHQDLPFERLVDALRVERDLSRTPLFQAMFILQNAPVRAPALPGLRVETLPLRTGTSKFDLTLSLREQEGALEGQLEYSADLFEASTIERMVGHFQTLLEGITASPQRRMSELPLLTEAERRQVLVEWNDSRVDLLAGTCVHHLFEAQVERTPEATALVAGQTRFTYRELNARANQLAHHLRSRGVGPEVRVGVCLERTADLVVALLAILKAGGAYVPLDPAHPAERLSYALGDARAPLLLTQHALRELLSGTHAEIVCLDTGWQSLVASRPAGNLEAGASPNNLSYVLYTSGSTGRPKGVALTHQSAVAFLRWALQVFSREELAGTLAATSITFDLSVFELFAPLGCGGTVLLAENALALPSLPAREQVTLVNTVPSAMAELVRSGGVPPSVRTVNLAGEPLPGALARGIYQLPHVQRLYNLYGPTEDTTYSTFVLVPRQLEGEPTIGRPLAGTQAYIVDDRMQPVPVGVPGELFLGGAGLARGYLGRPELTAERFIPNPFSPEAGARLYRTGDRARFLSDGTLEYLGRADFQVKVRGFRIELGEVEAALRGCAGVRDVVVAAREEGAAGRRLVGYVVAAAGVTLEVGELRRQLKERLPEYMVPSAFVVLEALPLTPNGKVDRKALPAPEGAGLAAGRQYVAPRTPTEELLAAMWAQLLGVARVGVEDNFFELGGHSLLVTQALSRVRDTFGVGLPVRDMFDAPTLAELAGRVDAAKRAGEVRRLPALKKASRTGPEPLSFAQQRLWFLERLEPGSPLHNIPVALRLEGALDAGALERSFLALVRRHEVLRTTFQQGDGEPVQVVYPATELPLAVVDLRELPAKEREAEARRLAGEEARRPFDLSAGPLLRATLMRLGEAEHVLVLVMHHIISDGWSTGVLVGEVKALYEAFTTGGESPLEELPLQYADHARWQREWLRGEVLEEQLAYWRRRLEGAAHALELPTDRPRPPARSFRGATHRVRLSAELLGALRRVGQQEGATLFMTLLAGFQALLHRYSGQQDISVGSPIAGRNHVELEPLIGFFVNTLVLRSRVRGEAPFRELLKQVKEASLGAYAHQDVPFEKLVEELQPVRDLSRTPLFQVMFVLQNAPTPELSVGGMKLQPLEVDSQTSKFDLTLSLAESEAGLEGVLEYSTELFERSTIARMAEHLRVLLEGVAADAGRSIAELPLLTEEERRQLRDWNDVRLDAPRDACIHELFEAQVERTPEAVAVEFEGRRLTYRELNRRANQLAHHLRTQGVGPEVRVGVCLDRSEEMVAALLGVLKAGGAYVPMDPVYPEERLALMLEDARAGVLVTQTKYRERFGALAGAVVCLDEAREALGEAREGNPRAGARGGDLAYVIYTSGSTGRPKGVAIEHQSAVAFLHWSRSVFAPEELSGMLASTSICFDLSVFELFAPLSTGGTVVVVENALRLPSLKPVTAVTLVNTVPSAMAELVRSGGVPPSVRTVNLAGEPLPGALARGIYQLPHVRRLYNLYGPTEDTTYSTFVLVPRQLEGEPTIGRPLAGTQAYIVDDRMQPVPVGVPGELFLGGAGLARGYLGRPELTAERFIPNPFSPEAGARLYRTGDRARFLSDGTLEYLGRADFQVKVRGFRIELGEVEAALRGCAGVRDVVVAAREEGAAGRRLVGYVVAAAGVTLEVGELRRQLKERLPEYMVPSAFVVLEALPLTPNGKVDRKALPAPEGAGLAAGRQYVAPRTPTEELLAAMWAQLLGVARVGVEDNFFELGGHSLLAMQVVARVRDTFQAEVPLRELFAEPTIAGLAGLISRARQGPRSVVFPRLQKVSREGPVPLSFAQWRLWFLDRLAPDSRAFGMFQALRLTGELDTRALERSLDEVVRRHDILRTRFPVVDGKPVQLISPHVGLALPVADLSILAESEREARVEELAREESRQPFDLAAGPLLRLMLLQMGPAEHVLLLHMHHIIGDDWSAGVFAHEVSLLYAAFSAGQPSPLPELGIQYTDFVHWQQQWLTDEFLAPQLEHWKRHLGPSPAVLDLPTDRPRPATQSFRGAIHPFTLGTELVGGLQELARREGSTMFVTLLAGFAAALHRYAGQPDVIVGVPTANRTHHELEELIGLFVNILPIRLQFGGEPTYREMLARARGAAVEAYDHQSVPFEKLLHALQLKRDQSRPALRQVGFSFMNASRQTLQLPGLSVSRLEVDPGVARLELMLLMWEEEGRIAGRLEYNTDLFDASTISSLVGCLEALFADMVAHPEKSCLELPPDLAARRERSRQQLARSHEDESLKSSNLTENQMPFWFIHKLQPDVELYFENVEVTFSITGKVDVEHFQRAWQALVDRSDAMRSLVEEVDGVPRWRVLEKRAALVELADFSQAASPRDALAGWLRDMPRERMPRGKPLFRCSLAKLGEQRFAWHLRMHHLIADGWTLSIVFQNMSDLYQRSVEGRLEEAPALPAYQRYMEYERERRTSPEYARSEAYMRAKLADSVPLPAFYRTDSGSRSLKTERHEHALEAALSQYIKSTAAQTGLFSPAIVFLTALLAYVHRLTGEPVIRVGTPLANRPEGFKDTIGLFMTVTPLQVHVEGEDTFHSLAAKVQREFIQTVRHQGYPVRNPPDARVFDLYFNYQNISFGEFSGMRVDFEMAHSGHGNDSLALQVRDFAQAGQYTLDFDLRCDAFDPEQQRRTVQHYLGVLDALLKEPERPLRKLSLLSSDEQRTLLTEWNRTRVDYQLDTCLHHLIEAQVDRTPDAIALRYEDARCTYRELDERANQLAHHLRELGVGPDVPVAVCMYRSLELVISLVAILKAGGAYVPLDPDYPRERLTYMLADSGAPVLITQGEQADFLSRAGTRVVRLDRDAERISRERRERPHSGATDQNLAYVIYTSGSTGKPKGAAIEHRGICNRLLWMQDAYGLGAEDRVLQKTPFSFDVSVWEFFWPLMTGACLVVARPGGHQDSSYLVDAIRRWDITTLHFVPSMLQVFLENQDVPLCHSLKRVICSGEALPIELQKRFVTRLDAELHNLYGPTEASVDVTYHACEREDFPPRVPIGRPIANTQIYLLDRDLNPVPRGIAGELYIGGVGLARCYLHRPELTAEKFVCDPFSDVPGARLYRTGDLARHRADGSIEYLGRIDHQVKIRGLRIELGEIEAALATHPGVREASVTVWEERAGDKRLVGYVVPATGTAPSSTELRAFLKELLPEYMVPAAFLTLEAMPLSPAGKVDRRRLPRPDWAGLARGQGFVAPRTEAEKLIAKLCAELLQLPAVGLSDDFFSLGGNSLLATQFLEQLRHAFLVEVPLSELFSRPTIANLVEVMGQRFERLPPRHKQAAYELLLELEQLPEAALDTLGGV
jgi:amino acid adenylation domain-containing protein